jgi:NDP-sugar pyrophosphorylase family protein
MNLEMKAMLLVAGEGTRLRPLTLETPKALLPIEGVPLIEHQLSWLKNHGVSEFAINLHHLGEKIRDFLGNGSRFGVRVVYSEEETLLGTAGGVKRMEHFFNDTFVVVYGDVLTEFNLTKMLQFHHQKKALATLAIFKAANPREVAVVTMDEEGRILRLVEKPQLIALPSALTLASGGIYILEREVLSYIPSQGFSDFAYDIFPKLISLELPLYGYLLEPGDCLIDIGTLDKYHKANEDVRRWLKS